MTSTSPVRLRGGNGDFDQTPGGALGPARDAAPPPSRIRVESRGRPATPPRSRWIFLLAALASVCRFAGAETSEDRKVESPRCEVRWTESLLSVRAEVVPLETLLQRVGDAAGLRVGCRGPCDQLVTATVSGLPLDEALPILFSSSSYVLIYGGGDQAPSLPSELIVYTFATSSPARDGDPRPDREPARIPAGGSSVSSAAADQESRPVPDPPIAEDAFSEERREQAVETFYAVLSGQLAGTDDGTGSGEAAAPGTKEGLTSPEDPEDSEPELTGEPWMPFLGAAGESIDAFAEERRAARAERRILREMESALPPSRDLESEAPACAPGEPPSPLPDTPREIQDATEAHPGTHAQPSASASDPSDAFAEERQEMAAEEQL